MRELTPEEIDQVSSGPQPTLHPGLEYGVSKVSVPDPLTASDTQVDVTSGLATPDHLAMIARRRAQRDGR